MSKREVFKYKGYIGSLEFSVEDKCLFGKIEMINDLITYEAQTISDLEFEFQTSVDDYLVTCNEVGKDPDRPCSGSFNIRIGAELHRTACVVSIERGISLNELVKTAVTVFVNPHSEKLLHEHKHIHYFKREVSKGEVPYKIPTTNDPLRYIEEGGKKWPFLR